MSAGTKVFLAFVAVLAVVVAVYYMGDEPESRVEGLTGPAVASADDDRGDRLPSPDNDPTTFGASGADEARVTDLPDLPIEAEARAVTPPPPSTPAASDPEDDDLQTPPASMGLLTETYLSAIGQPTVTGSFDDPDTDPLDDAASGDPGETPPGTPPADDDNDDTPPPPPNDPDPAPVEEPKPGPPAVTPPKFETYTVRGGDTMSSIAELWFGDEQKWDLIAKANEFVDPARLQVGQDLRLPPKDATRVETPVAQPDVPREYVVRSGDSLSRIARTYYSNGDLWRIIHDANRTTIGDDPARLRVGMKLVIPPAPQPATESSGA